MNKIKLLSQLKNKKLYCFTPSNLKPKNEILTIAKMEIKCGADILQLREKKLSKKEKLDIAIQLRKISKKHGALFIVNDDVDIAYLAEADGVHLGQNDIPPYMARKILKDKIIGLSVSNFKEYEQALNNKNVDYIAIGPIFPTNTKKDISNVVGIRDLKEMLKNKKKITGIIGGINLDNINKLKALPIDFFAIISAIVLSDNICKTIQIFKEHIGNL